jgi:hypothetical protein
MNLPELAAVARREGPMVLVVDAGQDADAVCACIRELRADAATAHLPILAFAEPEATHAALQTAGATLAVSDAAVSTHFAQLLEQVLRLD